jgi:hypothetical protein
MGRRQSSQLISWNATHEATGDFPCGICMESWSSKTSRVTVVGSDNPKWARPRLKLSMMRIITLPEGVTDRSAIRLNALNTRFVTPLLKDDVVVDTPEEASSFPLPHSRSIYSGWINDMLVCAPCYYRMKRNLEATGAIDPFYMSWIQARVLRRGQLINAGTIHPEDKRGYVDRREGPLDRRRVERRRTDVIGPGNVKPITIKREE